MLTPITPGEIFGVIFFCCSLGIMAIIANHIDREEREEREERLRDWSRRNGRR